MLKSFTRNYEDNSTEAGFEFTFYCDICNDGFRSSFIESETYKKGKNLRGLTQGIGVLGSFLGGRVSSLGYDVERGGSVLSERFEGQSPEWRKEHEIAFEQAQNESQRHFHRCHSCHKYVCESCFNEDEGLCTECAPRQEIYVAQARAEAMRRNIDLAGEEATVWRGAIESKTTICPSCGKPAGTGKFCNNCGASMALQECSVCGAKNAQNVRFCNNCGSNLAAPAPDPGLCGECGFQNPPGVKFCGGCGSKL
ncbi:MAG: zinc ribbon domain-containing protein [Eubacteriales bacterium]|nr:zinc ribbon domain-containing protein [Eubacteriales bacterium]MDD4323904.1 zinc ribbon domain-containing protein [Eubacteriales bacterium]MDD4541030.1 zinc ribbon domain-containing protein [Eubacteriales bacterium]